MKTIMLPILLLSISLIVGGCESKQKKESENKVTSWPEGMLGLSKDLGSLLPYVFDKKAYHSFENEEVIRTNLTKFSKDSHKISPKMSEAFAGKDPLIQFSLTQLQSETGRALKAFNDNNKEYSRGILRNVVSYCIRCHTRNNLGPQNVKGSTDLAKLRMSPLAKANLYVAVRNYDKARETYESVIQNVQHNMNNPFDLEKALRNYLSLMVRVKKQPEPAIEVLNKINGRDYIPFYLSSDITKWTNSLERWSRDKKRMQGPPKNPLKTAKSYIRKAQVSQEYLLDHSGDVEYLVASSILHDGLLKYNENPKRLSESYYLLGRSYEVLGGEIGFWNLHEHYYESCIRKFPKGKFARRCYSRLESSIYAGYSGSAGTHVPLYERKRLNELKGLLGLGTKK